MTVTPKTEKEIAELTLLPKGTYPFDIVKAEEKTSKKGNEMIALNLKIYHGEQTRFVNDYLMDTEFGAGKLRHCAKVCGLLDDYESGALNAPDMEGRSGFVKLGIEKDKTGKFSDKNTVLDYLSDPQVYDRKSSHARKASAAEADGDNIPF